MPYNSTSGAYERRATTVIDATPDGDTVAVAIDVKLDQGIDDYVVDLNHHKTNGNHYPATSVHTDSRFLDQSPAGVVSWKDGVPAAGAALKDMSNVASGAIPNAKLASEPALTDFSNVASNAILKDKIEKDALVGYNYIINGNFDIFQRGTSQTTYGYGSFDRWFNAHGGSAKTVIIPLFENGASFPDGQTCPNYFSRTTVTSVVGAANYVNQIQRIESVKTLAGKKAVLSFYAKSDASRNMAVELTQYFGSGGTPSAQVNGIGVQKVTLTTAWQRLSFVFDIPSILGKTIGTDKTDNLSVKFWFDAGSDYNASTASLGQQSGAFDIACVSLVEGDKDIKPIPRSYGEELALCQRYYQQFSLNWRGYLSAFCYGRVTAHFATSLRVHPTFSIIYQENINTGSNWIGLDANTIAVTALVQATAAGETYISSYMRFDAEL